MRSRSVVCYWFTSLHAAGGDSLYVCICLGLHSTLYTLAMTTLTRPHVNGVTIHSCGALSAACNLQVAAT